jgi:thymidylate synthase ThyX
MYKSSVVSPTGIEAHVVLASKHQDREIWTLETKAPKFIDAEFEKHRMLSSNSSSSRAIPFQKHVENATFYPQDIRAAEKGMQGSRSVDLYTQSEFLYDVSTFRAFAIKMLAPFKDRIHKQHLNRYLEPWAWQKKVVTATEWDNFFQLRLAPGAQPEIQELARCMKQAMDMVRERNSFQYLEPGQWHLPYVLEDMDEESGLKCSTARCARVSYMTHDNESPVVESDVKLHSNLLADMHMTPFEHQATPMRFPKIQMVKLEDGWEPGVTHWDLDSNVWSGNFNGWIQHRQLVSEWNK